MKSGFTMGPNNLSITIEFGCEIIQHRLDSPKCEFQSLMPTS